MKTNFTLYLALAFILINFNCSNQKKEFTIWIGGAPQELDFWGKLISDFNSQTENNLILVRQPTYSDQRRQSLVISLEAKQHNPDLFLMDVVWINQFIKSGWLEKLNTYISKNNFSLKPFFPKILNKVDKLNNKLYALPVFLDAGLLYYRKDLLKKYGFDFPKNWKELVEQSKKIQVEERKINKSFNGFVWQGAQYEGLVCTFLEFISSNGGGLIEKGKIKINNKENLIALQFMQDLIHKYKISPPNTFVEMKEEEVRRAFQSGNALFERNWSYAWSLHQLENSNVKGKTGISILPHFINDSSVSALGGWHIGLSKYSDVKNEAWEFIKFVTSYKVQKTMFEKIGWNPARKDIYNDKNLVKKYPRLKILEKALDNSAARPSIPYYPQVSQVIQRYVNECLAKKISPENALIKMQEEINYLEEIYQK